MGAPLTLLSPLIITAAVTDQVVGAAQGGLGHFDNIKSLSLFANFVYGSGAAVTAKARVQTSFDGTTWFDIACFSFTTASVMKAANISSNLAFALAAVTDGALADDTAISVLGTHLRVKLTSTGTYAGGTTLTIHAVPH